jgi:muramoyltetrapeptide carboxypeptidase
MKTFVLPKHLKPGDKIGIIAPAASFNDATFQKGVSVIKSLGFDIDIPDEIYHRKRYLAGDDEHRANGVQWMMNRSDIDAIVCARGGFGTLRMMSYLPYANFTSPKRLIGFSDITVLLNVIAFQCNWITFHGPVVTMLADADLKTIDSFYHALTTPVLSTMPSSNTVKILSKGNNQYVSGRLWGGNLTTLCHMVATPFEINCSESIIFLEDRGEALYRIDRLLSHMRLTSCFDHVKGVMLGSFKDCGNIEDIYEIVIECFGDQIPIFAGFECGHELPNYTFPLGCKASMDTDSGDVNFCL